MFLHAYILKMRWARIGEGCVGCKWENIMTTINIIIIYIQLLRLPTSQRNEKKKLTEKTKNKDYQKVMNVIIKNTFLWRDFFYSFLFGNDKSISILLKRHSSLSLCLCCFFLFDVDRIKSTKKEWKSCFDCFNIILVIWFDWFFELFLWISKNFMIFRIVELFVAVVEG